ARGVTLGAAALGSLLAAEAVSAAPVALSATISGSALAATAGAAATTTLLKVAIMTKLKTGILGAVALAGVTATLLIQDQAHARLQRGEQALRQGSDILETLRADRTRLAALANGPGTGAANNLDELNRLRA